MAGMLVIALLAQAEAQEIPETVYKPVTEIDMGGAEVTASVEGPDGVRVKERQAAVFNPMITLRTDFTPELRHSVSEMK